jgi:hypothetical protein
VLSFSVVLLGSAWLALVWTGFNGIRIPLVWIWVWIWFGFGWLHWLG